MPGEVGWGHSAMPGGFISPRLPKAQDVLNQTRHLPWELLLTVWPREERCEHPAFLPGGSLGIGTHCSLPAPPHMMGWLILCAVCLVSGPTITTGPGVALGAGERALTPYMY